MAVGKFFTKPDKVVADPGVGYLVGARPVSGKRWRAYQNYLPQYGSFTNAMGLLILLIHMIARVSRIEIECPGIPSIDLS